MKLKEELTIAVVSYVNKKLTADEFLCKVGDILQDSPELSTNQRLDIMRDINRAVGTAIIKNVLNYIL